MKTFETQNQTLVLINTREQVNPNEVIMQKADANYTVLYFKNGKKKMIAQTLKHLEPIFTPYQFYRTHQSYLINMNCIEWISHEVDSLQMIGKQSVVVARNRKNGFLDYLNIQNALLQNGTLLQ